MNSPEKFTPVKTRALGIWPKVLFAAASLGTLVVLVLLVTNRHEVAAAPGATSITSARAEREAAAKIIPAPVPDAENFAATPFFAALFPKPKGDDTNRWPDDFSRADTLPRQFPVTADTALGRRAGKLPTDLIAWQKAFEQTRTGAEGKGAEIVVTDAPELEANARAAKAVLAALQPYAPVLAELESASHRPYSRFNVNYNLENPWGILLPHLAIVKRTVQLLRLKASAEVAANESQASANDVLLMLALSDSPRNEPTLISHLVRAACLQITMQPTWEALASHRWSDSQLQAMQNRLQRFNFIADLKLALESERAWANVTIGLVRDKREPKLFLSMAAEGEKVERWQEEAERAFLKCPREWFDLEQTNYNRLIDERLLSRIDVERMRVQPNAMEEDIRVLQQTIRGTRDLLDQHLVFSKLLLPALGRTALRMVYAQATVDFASLGCALERYRLAEGRYPSTLAALSPRFISAIPNDRVNGEPLHYQVNPEGTFLLYSVGWNETDEAGELAFLPSGRGVESKDGDWVWTYAAAK